MILLYVNGDSHTAAAEAMVRHAFAEDDPVYEQLGRQPHPDNLEVSWPMVLSRSWPAILCCEAESASSNQRIIRTTKSWIEQQRADRLEKTLVIIQWSTWERQEWLIDGRYYQITASGIDDVPAGHAQHYKEFVSSVDWTKVTNQAHDEIWQFHFWLERSNIRHIFFNGDNDFSAVSHKSRRIWGTSYIAPYDKDGTYSAWCRNQGMRTVSRKSWHFGKDAHSKWAAFMLQYCDQNQYRVKK